MRLLPPPPFALALLLATCGATCGAACGPPRSTLPPPSPELLEALRPSRPPYEEPDPMAEPEEGGGSEEPSEEEGQDPGSALPDAPGR